MKLVFLLVVCGTIQAVPLWFEPNQGQAHPSVRFLAHSPGGYVYFGRNRMAVRDVRMDLVGAHANVKAELEQPLDGISNYFIGRNERDWRTGIPHYGSLRYQNIYAGIDLVYYANGRDVEFDFIVQAGADPRQIKLAYNKPVHIQQNGDLSVAGLRQRRPKVYQDGREIGCYYLVRDERVELALSRYDPSRTLTIDPVLEFSTFLGGPGDDSLDAVAVDNAGFVYVAGYTSTPATPILDPFKQPNIVVYTPIIFKFTQDGQKLIYYTTIDSNSWGWIYGVAVDPGGRLVLAGGTWATNFPLKNPIQTEYKAGYTTGFVTILSPDGKTIQFSTYLGGSVDDRLQRVAVDSTGAVYVSGQTRSKDYPTKNAFQSTFGGGYYNCVLTKITSSGSLAFSTYLGSAGWENCGGLAVAPDGNVLVAGSSTSDIGFPLKNPIQATVTGAQAPFLAKVSPDGQLLFSSFFGGANSAFANVVATDQAGNIYLAGSAGPGFTTKNAFQPVTLQGSYSAFVAKFDSTMNNLIYATYLGGSGYAQVFGLGVDANNSVLIGGTLQSSPDFPLKNELQPFRGGGIVNSDMFAAKLAPDGRSLIYSTPIGGIGNDQGGYLALDKSGSAYLVGFSGSNDFPLKNAYQQSYGGGGWDGAFFKLSDNTPVAPSPITANPGHLSFRYTQGGIAPAPQPVAVAGPAFTVGGGASWINAKAAGSTVMVSVNPAGLAPGTYNASLNLVPQSGAPASVDVTFTVLSLSPVLTSVEPSLVPVGANATVVIIHGSGFTKDTVVQLNGVSFTPVVFVDANTLRISLPQSYLTVEYNHTIAVQNPTSDLSNTLSVSVGTPAPQISAVTNAASFSTGPVAPGEIVTIFGANLTAKVSFDNIPATLVYASATQVSVTVPYSITGPATMIQVGSSAPVKLDVARSAPGIFAAVPAGNNVLTLYATGCGALTTDELPRCALPVAATVKDQPATVLYAGIAPGLVEGVNQVNLQLPDGVSSGPLTVVLAVGDASSKPFSVTLP